MAGDDLSIHDEVDVLVAGGGPAGVAAAVRAARAGARTLLVEQTNCLGGVATAGGHNHLGAFSRTGGTGRIVGGVIWQIAQQAIDRGFAAICDGTNLDFEPEPMKLLLDRWVAEAGASVLFHTFYCDSFLEGDAVVGAVIQNKSGRSVIRARRIVDCTGDGDAAAGAGCRYEVGRPSDHACQPATLMFTIGGVDWDRVCAFRGKDYRLEAVWARAQADGFMEPIQNQIMGWWHVPTRPDQVSVNFTHVTGVDATRAEDLSRATVEGRRQAFHCLEVFRRYIPGMENAYIISTAPMVGLRESRRIIGEVVVREDDIKSMRPWPDTIGMGSFFIDVHGLTGPGMEEAEVWRPGPGFAYQMPYRMLVPEKIDNLLVAGRCVSCTHVALGSLRVMAPCAVMGEAAGLAAALSVAQDVPPRRVDVAAMQSALRAGGAILDDRDVAAAGPVRNRSPSSRRASQTLINH